MSKCPCLIINCSGAVVLRRRKAKSGASLLLFVFVATGGRLGITPMFCLLLDTQSAVRFLLCTPHTFTTGPPSVATIRSIHPVREEKRGENERTTEREGERAGLGPYAKMMKFIHSFGGAQLFSRPLSGSEIGLISGGE